MLSTLWFNFAIVKNLLIIIALTVILRPALPVVDYIINYDYISEVLCVNKDRPELECNGKCYLMQSLAKAAEKENDQKKDNSVKKVEIPTLFNETIDAPKLQVAVDSHSDNFPDSADQYKHLDSSNFFHPPIA